jgi:hypothetical protein
VYYYAKADREFGPIPADQLVELFDRGVVLPDDRVRVDGTTSWRAAIQMVGTLRGSSTRVVPALDVPGRRGVTEPVPSLDVPGRQGVTEPVPSLDVPGRQVVTERVPSLVLGGDDPEERFTPIELAVGPMGVPSTVPAPPPPPPQAVLGMDPPVAAAVRPRPPGDAPRIALSARVAPVAPARAAAARPRAARAADLETPTRARAEAAVSRGTGGRILLTSIVVVIVAAVGAVLVHEYTAELGGEIPPVGSTTVTDSSLVMTAGRVVLRRRASSVTGTASLHEESSSVLTVLGPDSFRLSFPVGRMERTLDLPGQPPVTEGRETPLRGRSVLVDGPERGRRKALEGGSPNERERLALEEVLTDFRGAYPEGRVFPGRGWSAEPRWLCGVLALDDRCTGSVRMQVVRFVRYQGERAAEVELHAQVKGQREGLTVEITLTGKVYRSIERRLDLETLATGTLRVTGEIQAGTGGAAMMELDGPVELTIRATRGGG